MQQGLFGDAPPGDSPKKRAQPKSVPRRTPKSPQGRVCHDCESDNNVGFKLKWQDTLYCYACWLKRTEE